MFEDEIGLAALIIRCADFGRQSNEDMIMSQVPSFGAPGSLIFVVVAS
jgi:hypothetical protein